MSEWFLTVDNDVLTYNGYGLIVSDRVPYIDIKCPAGFDPEEEGCGKSYGTWSIVSVGENVWRFSCKYSIWHDLFYNNRDPRQGDFRASDGAFQCVGSGNTDLVVYMDGLFRACSGLTSCVTIDTSSCINLSAMFSECSNLTAVPYLNTERNLDFNCFVNDCRSLTSVDPGIVTTNGRSFWQMYQNCTSIVTIPTIDLRNANDTYWSEFSERPGNDRMFHDCVNLKNVHLIGGSGVSYFGAMFLGCDDTDLEITWDDCYLPLVTGNEIDYYNGTNVPMFSDSYTRPFKSISSMSFPNLARNFSNHFPRARKYGNIIMPRVDFTDNDTALPLLIIPQTCTEIGTFDFSNAVASTYTFVASFEGCSAMTKFPDIRFPSTTGLDYQRTFADMPNVGAGAYNMYLTLSANNPSSTYHTFYNCGTNTLAGQADLARIPNSWK